MHRGIPYLQNNFSIVGGCFFTEQIALCHVTLAYLVWEEKHFEVPKSNYLGEARER